MLTIFSPPKYDFRMKTNGFREDLFLAGGISSCPDWQSQVIGILRKNSFDKEVFVANPKRQESLSKNSDEAKK